MFDQKTYDHCKKMGIPENWARVMSTHEEVLAFNMQDLSLEVDTFVDYLLYWEHTDQGKSYWNKINDLCADMDWEQFIAWLNANDPSASKCDAMSGDETEMLETIRSKLTAEEIAFLNKVHRHL